MLRGGVIQCRAHLARNIEQIPDGEALAARQHGSHAVALYVLHCRTELPVDFSSTENGNNVLAGQISRSFSFGEQGIDECKRAVAEWSQVLNLEGHDLIRFLVQRLINLGGFGLGKLALDFEPLKN